MRTIQDSNRALYWFDNLSDLVAYIDNTTPTWPYRESSREQASRSWDLNAGYEGALAMARTGWLEGAQRAQEALAALPPASPAPAYKNDFYGHMPHVPRFCAGAPDNMIRHTNPPRAGWSKVLTLVVPLAANCDTNAEYMANYGLGLAQYVNQLETDGVRVEVLAAISLEISGKRVAFSWRFKEADQYLDLCALAFSVGHPAMFRRLGFSLIERCTARPIRSYGKARDTCLSDLIDAPLGAVILNGVKDANTIAKTPELALAAIGAEIEKAMEQA